MQGVIEPSLSPAPLVTVAMPVPFSLIPQELSENFWQNSSDVSQRSRQKGFQNAFER